MQRTGALGRLLVVATAAAMVAVAVGSVGAGAATGGRDPAVWAEQVCRRLVDFQARALDARDGLWSVAHGPAPTDRAARSDAVRSLRGALREARTTLDRVDARLAASPPRGRGAAAVRDGLREGYAPVAEAYADAASRVRDLKRAAPRKVPAATAKVLRRLDRATDRATRPITRLQSVVRRSSVADPLAEVATCRPIGPDWSLVATADPPRTPPPPAGADALPGAVDLTAPALLLPGRSRPAPDVAALAAETAMTGRARTYFYGARPVVETGSPFVADCPAADAEHAQILGCFHDGRIYVLAVTRPEVAQIVPVTAAHEMLHAAYDAARDGERDEIDGLLADFYAATPDPRLHDIIARYDERAPANRGTELHSLVPTQVPVLSPALDAYYADYFHDRTPVLRAYDGYMTLFEGLIARSDALSAEIADLRTRIETLRSQSDAAAGEAERLGGRIDALRAQGRIAESNALVPAQNDAARRAQALNAEGNALVDQHNARVDELNGIATEIGGLQSSLRPLG